MTDKIINIGILGAAKIGNWGMVMPCREVESAQLYAVAARDHERAAAYAKQHDIPKVHNSYQALLDDPAIDAIYNPLPNSLHCEWSIKALQAGKHVLCEKPFASNAHEAQRMADAAQSAGRVLMEGAHYRFHPMAQRLREGVAALGDIYSIATNMCAPIFSRRDIRYRYDLAGGATMDVGAYSLGMLNMLAAAAINPALRKPPEIISAKALLRSPTIDRAMKVALCWEDGTEGKAHHSMWSSSLMNMSVRVIGKHGELRVINPYAPHFYNRFSLLVSGKKTVTRVPGETSYTCQLREFVRRINSGAAYSIDLPDSIDTMRMIDAAYTKAGLPLRGLPNG